MAEQAAVFDHIVRPDAGGLKTGTGILIRINVDTEETVRAGVIELIGHIRTVVRGLIAADGPQWSGQNCHRKTKEQQGKHHQDGKPPQILLAHWTLPFFIPVMFIENINFNRFLHFSLLQDSTGTLTLSWTISRAFWTI